jgi:hypothetical protein
MPRNVYFSQGTTPEKRLFEDITIEALKIYGHDVYYIPRKIVNTNSVFNEDALSKFGEAFQIEMYVENTDGFEGDGDLLTKFGVEVRDSMTLILSVRRWEQLIGRFQTPAELRPQEGDLIYFPLVKGLFSISFVEDESPFYQLQNLPTFKLTCETFEYGNEEMDTGVGAIDEFETLYATRTTLVLGSGSGDYQVGEDVTQTTATASSNIVVTGEVSKFYTENSIKYLDITSQRANVPTAKVNGDVSGTTIILDNNVGTLSSGLKVRGEGINDFATVKTVTTQQSIILDTTVNLKDNTDLTFEHKVQDQSFKTTLGGTGNIIGSDSSASYAITTKDGFKSVDDNDPYAENVDFENIGNNFIDFSESNPFGEVNITS